MPLKDKEQRRAYHKRYYREHKQYLAAARKDWYERNKDNPERQKRRRDNTRKFYARNRDKYRKAGLQRCHEHPEQINANNAVHCAVRNGSLVPKDTCGVCGKSGKLEAHHPDYSKPLEVKWLHRKCHIQLHHKRNGGELCV